MFAAIILGTLWLLQTVFLQSFYNGMAIRNTKRLAEEILGQIDSENFTEQLDIWASEGSALIFITDWEGKILYSTDEHSSVYQKRDQGGAGSSNPYRRQDGTLSWQEGARHNLPADYDAFLRRLKDSATGQVDYESKDGTAYVYGEALPESSSLGSAVLYMSTPLGGAGAAVGILRVQLLWVTLASLTLASVLAWLLARQFARPVTAITRQARRLPEGDSGVPYTAGFCKELDEVSRVLADTAVTLQKLENARRELLANVSHDLRTPLTMIRGYAEMVREISWSDEEKREQDLIVIMREADRLTALVNDILEYSAAQSKEAERKPVNISEMVKEAAEPFMPLAQQKECEILCHVEPEIYALADAKHMGRVLYNLLDNGLRYTEKRLTVTMERWGQAARVEIRDDGPGIPAEEIPLVWERYFTSKQRGGQGRSGLGLAITKELLSAQKARFGVDSQVDGGTAFWFEVPIANE